MDNFNNNCPAMMSDGRFTTDFRSPTSRNEHIRHINNLVRDDEYRLFLQKNANNIMNNVWKYHKQNDSCSATTCFHECPTRCTSAQMQKEMSNYNNAVVSGTSDVSCGQHEDYRTTISGGEL